MGLLVIATAVAAILATSALTRWLTPRTATSGALAHLSVALPDGDEMGAVDTQPWVQGIGIWVMPLDGDRTPRPLFSKPAGEGNGQLSPDRKWIAYEVIVSSRREIYVAPFPGPGPRYQVSTDGGPSRSGRAMAASCSSSKATG